MTNEQKGIGKQEPISDKDANTTGNVDEAANNASSGAVLPDPEEIKLPPLYKIDAPHLTVIDVNKPRDNNTGEGNEDQGSWDFRRNK
jgi:hypothetical protein